MKITVLEEGSLVRGRVVKEETLDAFLPFIRTELWSPIIFEGNYRKEERFKFADFLALDIDDGLTIDECKERIKMFDYIIAPTKSHGIEKKGSSATDRYRVIIPLHVTIKTAKDYKDAIRAFTKAYLPEADKNAMDAARFFYPSPHEPVLQVGGTRYQFSRTPLPLAVIEFLENTPKEGTGFNNGLFAAAAELYKLDYDENEIKRILNPALKANKWNDWSKEDDLAIQSAWKAQIKQRVEQEASIPWWMRYLNESELIIDASDTKNYITYNKKTKKKKKVDKNTIFHELGRKDGAAFIKAGRSCFLAYRPLERSIFLTDTDGSPLFNNYNPPEWLFDWFHKQEAVEDCAFPSIYESLFNFFVNDNKESLEYLLDWLTNGLKKQNLTYLCAVATQGVGKNALGDIIKHLFGEENSTKVSHQVFKSHFNAALKNRRFVFVDEVMLTEDESIDRLKDLVNNTITIEEKGKDSESIANYANIYLATNRPDGIPLEVGDRRFSILNFTDVPLVKRPELLKIIVDGEHIKPENIAQLGRYLWNRTLVNNMLLPFKSQKTQLVAEAQYKHWERYILNMCKTSPGEPFSFDHMRTKVFEKYKIAPGDYKFTDLAKKCPDVLDYKDGALIGKGNERLPEL